MSTIDKKRKKVRIHDFLEMKKNGVKISVITCYDASFARLIELSKMDIVLVGDSLGNVIQGKNSTLPVTVKEMSYHIKCVRSALQTPLLIGDMPFLSAGISVKDTMKNAGLFMQSGAEAVKIEGATPEICEQISHLTRHGIPVMGHIGLMPQSVHALGGYRIQGKNESDKKRLLKEAKLLQSAGCFAIVLELITPNLAEELSKALKIPTIGIGSGNHCDGNVLVLQDMLGMNKNFKPKFLKHYLELEESIVHSLNHYCSEVVNKCSENE
ncbi:3-methyl-2-oxobutanoate hydroxymethyltransferase [Pigmentibacter sp. JX0631]|uniref:3-methyl-2-oxobutanoate hydroxymethyltransferase n=1 Tax=Pigmentibacter sp. JX0631 TaxID=2976982 RepID=UPI002469BF03|nr:3-methyl-2-oxobutanoate hydroxymethyltransferase [Pigmentibacter sp. JX0631]WGL58927.1 3-methyl-2-oxobutanoate hydroxymethyltransferase [Pigmentibacter sp. JX0631]